MAKKHFNENYVHSCDSVQEEILSKINSIAQMGFTEEQIVKIVEFYLFNAPVLKSDKKDDVFGLKSLKEYGWTGTSAMSKLEGRLLKSAGISIFCFIKGDSIDETLDSMNLGSKICTEHPRAVLKQNAKVVLYEDGSTEIRQQETRMECLFRHIRNAIAHNHTYLFDNGNILIEDRDDNGKISARLLMPRDTLIEWMRIVINRN